MARYVVTFRSRDHASESSGFYAVLDADTGAQARARMHYRTGRSSLPGVTAYRVPDAVPLTSARETVRSTDVEALALKLAGSCPACGHGYDCAGPGGICV